MPSTGPTGTEMFAKREHSAMQVLAVTAATFPSFIDFGRETCCSLDAASDREWLVTNGIGGFASGTVAAVTTSRYHGLLVAALKPPLRRTLRVAKLEETAQYEGRRAQRYRHEERRSEMKECSGART